MDSDKPIQQQRDQLLKMVAKAFYRELAKYGVAPNEVLTVTNHLLENLVSDGGAVTAKRTFEGPLKITDVNDQWHEQSSLTFAGVTIRPLKPQEVARLVLWLDESEIRNSFVPALPDDPWRILQYFSHPSREYLAILNGDAFVGVIGAENIDLDNRKLEMKKLIGELALRGKGIGTRATFAFLYHAFVIRKMHKVFLYSRETNMQNLNLNARLGFELEGVLLEEFKHGSRREDVVRMGLLEPLWHAMFAE